MRCYRLLMIHSFIIIYWGFTIWQAVSHLWITINCGKFWKRWEYQTTWSACPLRNLYAGQEAVVRNAHETTDWFQVGKGVHQGWILSPCLFNFYAEYIMRNVGLEEHKLESRLPGEISITSDMQMTPPLWQKVEKNSRAYWWKWKRRMKKLA